jgi:hypothetical protein
MNPLLVPVVALCLGAAHLAAADTPAKPKAAPKAAAKAAPFVNDGNPEHLKTPLVLPPDENVSYGPHKKQVMYFWRAKSDQPTPLLFYIHGGGWANGDRSSVNGMLKDCLAAGISVVSVEYRFVKEATADGVTPPVKGPMLDCARALQFCRSKAKEWNLDKTRIGASGGSAGACTSLWLAFHDDLADPSSADPIARESTRLTCAAVSVPQTSLDPKQMREWTPNSRYGAHAFGINGDTEKKISAFDAFYEAREKIMPLIKEYSPYELVSKDDPSVGLYFGTPPNLGKDEKDPTHTANFGVKLREHCDEIKVPCELVYPGAPDVTHKTATDFIIAHLKPKSK